MDQAASWLLHGKCHHSLRASTAYGPSLGSDSSQPLGWTVKHGGRLATAEVPMRRDALLVPLKTVKTASWCAAFKVNTNSCFSIRGTAVRESERVRNRVLRFESGGPIAVVDSASENLAASGVSGSRQAIE